MKVLHFYKDALPESYGGVEKTIDVLCRTTAQQGVDNTVLTLSKTPSPEPIIMKGYKVYQVKQNFSLASTGFSMQALKVFRQLAKQTDIIHYHFPNPFADLLHLSNKIKARTVVDYHSDIVKQKHLLKLYRPVQNQFLKSVDHIVATSPNYLKTSQILQQFSSKVTVIPHGIDREDYPELSTERLAYWSNRFQEPFFLFVGVLRYYKGLHTALEAVRGTPIRIVIAGSGGMEQTLRKQARGLNNVEFIGFISDEDKVALLELCQGFVFPSHLRSEAYGLSLVEAAMFSKPLISCEIGTGTTFINIANETGLVVEPSAPQALRDAMQFLLDNPKQALMMGQQAKVRMENLFTAEKQSDRYYKLYQALMKKDTVEGFV